MLHSIATVSLSGTLEEKIAAIADAGFAGLELFENDLIVHPGSLRDVRDQIRQRNLQLVAYQPFRDFEGLSGPARQRAMDRAERKFDVMAELGTELLLVCSSVHPAAQGGIDRCAADFHELGERAARRGFRVGYEALAWGRFVNDYRDAWEIVRCAEHPSIGLVLDTFHLFSRGVSVEAIQAIPGDRIFLVQMADAPRLSMDHLSWSRHYRCFPGQGELPIDRFMSALGQTGYAGPLSLEIFNDAFRAMSPQHTARDGRRSLNFVADFAQASGQPALPPRARPADVDFVEFTGDDERLDQLATLLRALGFAHVGQHVHKRVQRWMQGDVNLLLNYEPNSFASAFHEDHGTAVCAFALRLPGVRAAIERAKGLGLSLHSPRTGVDTHGMEALQSVDGSLIYLVDTADSPEIWRREFQRAEPAPPAPSIRTIDHISISMASEQVLGELLQYRAMFQMEPTPQFDITDPRGLVHSQALQSPEREVSVVLNSSGARHTVTGEFLQRFRGAGIQHIALRCDDIFAVAEAAMAAGLPLLEIPRNYYADLMARFAFTGPQMARLQRHHLLYDEDGTGRFWQFYTALVDGRFFFEVVQQDHYDGFGAPNAHVRAAAQRSTVQGAGAV